MISRRAYRRHLPHYQTDFRSYFVTFVTLGRWILPPAARTATLQHVLFDHGRKLDLHTAVVMPDHVHIVMTPLPSSHGEAYALTDILKGLKGASARTINRETGRSGPVWQHESFDHEIRRDESLRQKCEYVVQNPVRRGLVSSPDEYPWLWREWIEGRRQKT
jgi:REP element-mobilizing transposase RayT